MIISIIIIIIIICFIDIPQSKFSDRLIEQLTTMGHTIKVQQFPYPSVNIVFKRGDTLTSQSDGRGGGYAVKYGP